MPDEPRVQELLDELLDREATPEEVCDACPELLPAVRARWRQICLARTELDARLPIWPHGSLPTMPPGELPLPQVPGYEVEAVLGRGGMGVVYKARQVGLDRLVALKMIRYAEDAGPEEQARFRAEARAIARLLHPGIVQIHEVGECQGRPYFALEYCSGGSLDKQLDGTPWEAKRAARLVEALAEAVAAAHRAGIVHRDLKPGNVLLAADGTPKVTDFGLARRVDASGETRTGAILGTPAYMAPEQAEGHGKQAGPAADLWALGVILYELLTGRPPFKAVTGLETLLQVASREPVSVRHLQPAVPRDLETICHHCLEKDPKRRYASAEALAEDLRRFGFGAPVAARPVGRLVRLQKWARRRPAAAALIVLSVLTLAGLIAGTLMLAWRGQQLAERTEQQLDALVTLGKRDLQAGRFDAAMASSSAALALRPTDARAGELLHHAKVGQLLTTAKANDSPDNAAAALQALDKLLKLDPEHVEAKALKARVTGYEYLLDSTGLGFSPAQVRRLQEVWARRLGCGVEQTIEVAAGVTMTFVLIPPGKFRMGSPVEERERGDDERPHEVTLTEPFYLGKTEVTQAQYEALIGKNPSEFKGVDRPVEKVTWEEARDYTEKLTKKRSDKLVYRLPTEAEWEYACRGGRSSSQPFGIGDGRALSSTEANFDGDFPYGGGAKGKRLRSTCRVGSYPANALGLHDMHGNVYEWCADWYAEYPAGDVTNPRGPSEGGLTRVIRGGGWYFRGNICRAALRGSGLPLGRGDGLGFRVAGVPSGAGAK
jgi:formylglycine-generating enzyme required for sulfatase activity/predicted Ser/Thr protein kinase